MFCHKIPWFYQDFKNENLCFRDVLRFEICTVKFTLVINF